MNEYLYLSERKLKYPSAIVKLRWNLRESPEDGEWLVSPFFISERDGKSV